MKKSIRSTVTAIPLREESGLGSLTLPGFVLELANRYPNHQVLCWHDPQGNRKTWTYSELFSEAQKVAKALVAAGVGRNGRVGILVSNRPEWLFTMFGVAMAGGVSVVMNTFSTIPELEHQLKIADVELLLTEATVASKNFVDDIFTLCPELPHYPTGQLISDRFPFLRGVVCIEDGYEREGLQTFGDFITKGNCIPNSLIDAISDATCPVDQSLIFFSSGSTALPKAILQTHRAATLQCWRFGKIYDANTQTRSLPVNGFFFSGNFAMAIGTLSGGGCMVLMRTFDPDLTLQLLQTENITCLLAWPHQEARLRECIGWESADFSSLKYVTFNSTLRYHPTVNTDWLGWQGHGMTETFTIISATYGREFKDGSFGPILPGNTVRIVDPQSNEILPLGETGEIIVKGPTTMLGYLKVPPEEIFDSEGFIHTADAGHLGEDGHLYWEGRLSEIIKTGGANVSPTEIDEVLGAHPGVQRCCTVGVPHETLGEIVVSCVVLRDGHTLAEEDIQAFGKHSLSSYKLPRNVVFLDASEIPMTGSDKVRRSELRKIAEKRIKK